MNFCITLNARDKTFQSTPQYFFRDAFKQRRLVWYVSIKAAWETPRRCPSVRREREDRPFSSTRASAVEKIFFFESVRLLDELLVKLFVALFAELLAGLLSDLLGTCPLPYLTGLLTFLKRKLYHHKYCKNYKEYPKHANLRQYVGHTSTI